MNFADIAIRQKTVTLVLTLVMLGGGMVAYQSMSRLEDPEFTIKDALVITPYAGASATEVEEEVSDLLEQAVQAMGQLDEVESRNERGRSTLNVRIKKQFMAPELPQIWDELRRKIGDAQGQLPPAPVPRSSSTTSGTSGASSSPSPARSTPSPSSRTTPICFGGRSSPLTTSPRSTPGAAAARWSMSSCRGNAWRVSASPQEPSSINCRPRTQCPTPVASRWGASTSLSNPPAPWSRWKTSRTFC